MFTNVGFYVVWAILALLPLISAVVFPPTIKKKTITCLCVGCYFWIRDCEIYE